MILIGIWCKGKHGSFGAMRIEFESRFPYVRNMMETYIVYTTTFEEAEINQVECLEELVEVEFELPFPLFGLGVVKAWVYKSGPNVIYINPAQLGLEITFKPLKTGVNNDLS